MKIKLETTFNKPHNNFNFNFNIFTFVLHKTMLKKIVIERNKIHLTPCRTRGRILNVSTARGHLTPFYFVSHFERLLKFLSYSHGFNPLKGPKVKQVRIFKVYPLHYQH